MSYELTGILHKKMETETKGDNFQVRDFIVKQEGQYPQLVKFQLSGDKCGLISEIKEGWEVKVSFNIVGREWQEKYFTNLSAWKIAVVGRPSAGGDEPTVEDAQVVNEPPF